MTKRKKKPATLKNQTEKVDAIAARLQPKKIEPDPWEMSTGSIKSQIARRRSLELSFARHTHDDLVVRSASEPLIVDLYAVSCEQICNHDPGDVRLYWNGTTLTAEAPEQTKDASCPLLGMSAAVWDSGVMHLLETKGYVGAEVAFKDRAASTWCENATALAGATWRYRRVDQREFEKLAPSHLADLVALVS